ncbi:MAG: hypothetical protein KF791_08445 [Verrucomicrobiae bacterium]|nr:hypothetical protein [Verrucomicrobiae bacterium]
MKGKPKTANYRRCEIQSHPPQDENLQNLLSEAIRRVQLPHFREVGIGNSTRHLLTSIQTKEKCLCGELVKYSPGRHVPLVGIQEEGRPWQGTAPPKDSNGIPRNLQEQHLVFAVRENHVAVIQSRELDISNLNDFLLWLIQNAEPSSKRMIALKNVPNATAIEKLKRSNEIRAIELSGHAFRKFREPLPEGHPDRKGNRKYVRRIEVSQWHREILDRLGIGGPILDQMTKDGADPGSLSISIELRYRGRKDGDAQNLLRSLSASVGGIEGLDTTILLGGKSKIQGNELTVAEPIQVHHHDGNMSVDDAMARLAEWLMNTIRNKGVL